MSAQHKQHFVQAANLKLCGIPSLNKQRRQNLMRPVVLTNVTTFLKPKNKKGTFCMFQSILVRSMSTQTTSVLIQSSFISVVLVNYNKTEGNIHLTSVRTEYVNLNATFESFFESILCMHN